MGIAALRQGLRLWSRRPAALTAAVLTLALGVGTATSVFALLRALLSPLEFPRSSELVRLYETIDSLKSSPNPRLRRLWNQVPVSYLNAEEWRQRAGDLAGVGLYQHFTAVLSLGGQPEEVSASRLENHLLAVLAVPAIEGRWFSELECRNREPVVLLSAELWGSRFNADPGVVGRSVTLDGKPHQVVGVMPRGFELAGREDLLWTPLGPDESDLGRRDEHRYAAIARLAPGRGAEQAAEGLKRVAGDLAAAFPETNEGSSVRLVPWLETVVGDSRPVLRLVALAAALVLTLVVVNLMHLLLAEGVRRRDEFALRVALGCRRSVLLRQLILEVVPLGLLAAALGTILVWLAHRTLPFLLERELPRIERLELDSGVLLFALGVALGAILLAALLPGFVATGRGSAGGVRDSRRIGRLHNLLVIGEVAAALVLASLAGGLLQAWWRLSAVNPGLEAAGVLVQELRLPAWLYGEEGRRREFGERMIRQLEALPGQQGVALTSRLPQPGPAEVWGYRIVGQETTGGDWTLGKSAVMQQSSPGYFEMLGINVIEGESFSALGAVEDLRTVMVNRTLAERHWPGQSAVGAELEMGERTYRVVGVFEDLRHQGVGDEAGELMIQPWGQHPSSNVSVLIRFSGDPLARAGEVRRILSLLEPSLPLPPATLLEEVVTRSLVGPRARAVLLALAASTALLLSMLGIYGVMSHWTSRQRRELGIRLVLGADRRMVRRGVLLAALKLGAWGVGLGGLMLLASETTIRFGLLTLPTVDPVIVAVVAALVLATTATAAAIPAYRAGHEEPVAALRS